MGARTPSPDQPIELVGYVTDPKLVGYQILTNYESTYWRALVGNDAWSLYEILRSFCHEGNNTCRPSIKLLTSILGLQDKRAIIGRVKTVKGKEYQYPGLIDQLQEHGLVVAETRGEGHSISYLYHVNLTPSLLNQQQILLLPDLLQRKHGELLTRCEEAIAELESRKRVSRFPKSDVRQSEQDVGERGGKFPPQHDQPTQGGGNFPPGDGKIPTLDGKIPPEQHPTNNTHTTSGIVDQTTETGSLHNTHNEDDVVVALVENGISKRVATTLARQYETSRIREKIVFLHFLQATDPEKVKNPQGWLRRAIEEDYAQPDGYGNRTQREDGAGEDQEAELDDGSERAGEARRLALTWKERLVEQAQPAEALVALTDQLQADLSLQMTEATFSSWIASLMIVGREGHQTTIAAPSQAAYQWLTYRLKPKVERSLSSLVGEAVQVQFEVVDLTRSEEGSLQAANKLT